MPSKEKIVSKDGPFWTFLSWVVTVVTFGGNKNFLDGYLTTIGPIIGIPRSWGTYPFDGRWSAAEIYYREAILDHERVHVKQFTKYGFGSPWLGVLVMGFFYLFMPLPIGLAWFRWKFEREAYAAGIEAQLAAERAAGSTSSKLELSRGLKIDDAVVELSGPHYGWAWPFKKSVLRWFEQNVEHLEQIDVGSRPPKPTASV